MKRERPVLLLIGTICALLGTVPILLLGEGAILGMKQAFMEAYELAGLLWIAACLLVPVSALLIWKSLGKD